MRSFYNLAFYKKQGKSGGIWLNTNLHGGVSDGNRTHDNWNHNPGLYRLSYAHHDKII